MSKIKNTVNRNLKLDKLKFIVFVLRSEQEKKMYILMAKNENLPRNFWHRLEDCVMMMSALKLNFCCGFRSSTKFRSCSQFFKQIIQTPNTIAIWWRLKIASQECFGDRVQKITQLLIVKALNQLLWRHLKITKVSTFFSNKHDQNKKLNRFFKYLWKFLVIWKQVLWEC